MAALPPSLTPQLDTAVIEVSLVKALRLRGNPRRLYRTKHLLSRNWTYGDTGFCSGETSYLSMKGVTFAKDAFFLNHANLSYGENVGTCMSDHTNFTALEPCIIINVGTLSLLATTFW